MNCFILGDVAPPDFHWLECLSWAANVILAGAAVYALKQVHAAIKQAKSSLDQNKLTLEQIEVSRKDIILRSRREATALAIQQCERFAEKIIPHIDDVFNELTRRKYIPPQPNRDFPFIPAPVNSVNHQIWSDAPFRAKIINAMNEIESFAQYFTNDLADEGIAFIPTGQSFCHQCEVLSFFIGIYRQDNIPKLYQNTTKLYQLWKPRVERVVLEEQGKKIETLKSKLPPDDPRHPMGTKFS
ncbi:MAG TPA: hypothetical protein VHY30_02225 [Verrucomicrobiae bacterium]|jgi:hypothetical protein|nr:hypothetical protein [Verrucomicrobiae bacterium]